MRTAQIIWNLYFFKYIVQCQFNVRLWNWFWLIICWQKRINLEMQNQEPKRGNFGPLQQAYFLLHLMTSGVENVAQTLVHALVMAPAWMVGYVRRNGRSREGTFTILSNLATSVTSFLGYGRVCYWCPFNNARVGPLSLDWDPTQAWDLGPHGGDVLQSWVGFVSGAKVKVEKCAFLVTSEGWELDNGVGASKWTHCHHKMV